MEELVIPIGVLLTYLVVCLMVEIIRDYQIEKSAERPFTEKVENLTYEYVNQIDRIDPDEFDLKVTARITAPNKGNNSIIYGQFQTETLFRKKRIVISEQSEDAMLTNTEEVIIHELAHLLDHKVRGTSDHGPHFEAVKGWIEQQVD